MRVPRNIRSYEHIACAAFMLLAALVVTRPLLPILFALIQCVLAVVLWKETE